MAVRLRVSYRACILTTVWFVLLALTSMPATDGPPTCEILGGTPHVRWLIVLGTGKSYESLVTKAKKLAVPLGVPYATQTRDAVQSRPLDAAACEHDGGPCLYVIDWWSGVKMPSDQLMLVHAESPSEKDATRAMRRIRNVVPSARLVRHVDCDGLDSGF